MVRLAPPTEPPALPPGTLHRLRLDDRIDAAFAPVLGLAHLLDRGDRALRAALSFDREPAAAPTPPPDAATQGVRS